MKIINGIPHRRFRVYLIRQVTGEPVHRLNKVFWAISEDDALVLASIESEYLDWLTHHPELEPFVVQADTWNDRSLAGQLPRQENGKEEAKPPRRLGSRRRKSAAAQQPEKLMTLPHGQPSLADILPPITFICRRLRLRRQGGRTWIEEIATATMTIKAPGIRQARTRIKELYGVDTWEEKRRGFFWSIRPQKEGEKREAVCPEPNQSPPLGPKLIQPELGF